jgi:broad specificity phosphatase PhoE
MHLYVIRHGQSHINLPDYTDKDRDKGLTAVGHEQAAKLAAWLPHVLPQVEAIFCSSLLRARETVAPLAQVYGIVPDFDDRLREMGTNRWDHVAYADGQLPTPGTAFMPSERPYSHLTLDVEAESFMHFRTRVGQFVEQLVHEFKGNRVLVVCHGGVVEAIFDHVFNIGPWRRCEVWTRNTAVSLFEHVEIPKRETWRLHFHDRTEHLNPQS